jgi:hypothetical protein
VICGCSIIRVQSRLATSPTDDDTARDAEQGHEAVPACFMAVTLGTVVNRADTAL